MLLMGMCTSFTKKPMKPIMRKPTDVAPAMRANSAGRKNAGSEVRGEFWAIEEAAGLGRRTFPVRLVALLEEVEAVLEELVERLEHERVDVRHG
jgi:hypothetical protein